MELHSFWDGTGVEERISELQGRVPKQLGQLEVPHGQFNGPSGRALDTLYLKPLGLKRTECWITDLHDTYYVSVGNAKFLKKYEKLAAGIEGLTPVRFPQKPRLHKVPEERVESLKQEFCQAAPEWVITLGNDPINLIFNGRVGQLELTKYGVPFEAEVFGRRVKALCLCHPRQAAKLGRSSKRWFDAHQGWMKQAQGKGLVTLQE
jgi:uracil-DNA glycosylase